MKEWINSKNVLQVPKRDNYSYQNGGMNMIFDMAAQQLRDKGTPYVVWFTMACMYGTHNLWLTAAWTSPFYGAVLGSGLLSVMSLSAVLKK